MKKKDKKLEDFWDDLEVRKREDDREVQRKAVLATGAVLGEFWSVCFKVFLFVIALIFVLLWISSAWHQNQTEYHYHEPAHWGSP